MFAISGFSRSRLGKRRTVQKERGQKTAVFVLHADLHGHESQGEQGHVEFHLRLDKREFPVLSKRRSELEGTCARSYSIGILVEDIT